MCLLKKPSERKLNENYSMLIYGNPGVGKTTTALSARNPVLIDFEHGMDRVNSAFWVSSLEVESYNDVLRLMNSDELREFDTIVIDSMGALIDAVILHITNDDPRLNTSWGMSIQGYGILKKLIQDLIRNLKNQNKNLIFVAHSREDENEKKEKIVIPYMGAGSAGREILNILDAIGYMDRSSGKSVLKFASFDAEFYAKNSLELPNVITIPNPVKLGRNVFVQEVIDKYYRIRIEKVGEARKEYEKLCQDMEKRISKINSAETCNTTLLYFNNENIYSKVTTWKSKLWEKARDLGLSFNQAEKVFENVDNNAVAI